MGVALSAEITKVLGRQVTLVSSSGELRFFEQTVQELVARDCQMCGDIA
jgi:hypothetical protein